MTALSLRERLAAGSAYNSETGCIVWTRSRARPQDYGQIWWEGRLQRTHRLAWMLQNGPIPSNMRVCHHCDNPPCINVNHLFLGTHADNMHDMYDKGRRRTLIGEDVPSAKLTTSLVKAIRADRRDYTGIAEAYGISRSTVRSIRRRLTWKHVT